MVGMKKINDKKILPTSLATSPRVLSSGWMGAAAGVLSICWILGGASLELGLGLELIFIFILLLFPYIIFWFCRYLTVIYYN